MDCTDALQRILERLPSVKDDGRGGYEAFCPIHEADGEPHNRSLGLKDGDKKPILNCLAGCRTNDILHALGFTNGWRDVYGDDTMTPAKTARRNGRPKPKTLHPTIDATVAAYRFDPDLRDASKVIRYTFDDTFTEARFLFDDGRDKEPRPISRVDGGWICGAPKDGRPLYDLASVDLNQDVWLAEGPKDCEALRALGFNATTWSGGVNAWKNTDWKPLQGGRRFLIADAHDTGRTCMGGIAGRLTGLDCVVHVLEMPGVKDGGSVSDYVEDHDSVTGEDLARNIRTIADESPPWEPEYEDTDSELATATDVASSRHRKFHETDFGLAERLATFHGDDIRYLVSRGFLVWDGRCWKSDDTGEVMRRAKLMVRSMLREAVELPADDASRQGKIKFALRCESAQRLEAAIKLAQSERPIPIEANALDTDGFLFNCQNGTLDLREGVLCAHRRADHITKLSPVEYNADAQCKLWNAFLNVTFEGNAGLIEFVQRSLGSSLVGVVRDHVLHLLYGLGQNGKSTLVEAMHSVLGDYANTAAPGLMLRTYGTEHPTELADLCGVRFLSSMESGENRKLDEERVKQLTGGDTIKGRYMRMDFFDFRPTHTVFYGTNHKPTIEGTDYAIWRRIRLWPFTHTVSDEQRDPALGEKLRREKSGILAWLVRGCLKWQVDGLREPSEVLAATATYRTDSDLVKSFLDEFCTVDPNCTVTVKALFDAYAGWADRKVYKNGFGRRLSELGFEAGKQQGRRVWRGLGLLTDEATLI